MTHRAVAAQGEARPGGFGIYLHWPFCVSKCPYCDFNSHVRETVDHARWRQALRRELAHYAPLTQGWQVDSVFFGGGTPSLMAPDTVAALIEDVRGLWPVAPDLEITLEANPTTVEAGTFADLARAGVNRVSLGVQSFDDEALSLLGRAHSAREAEAALEAALAQFDRVSFDLIYALPGQTRAAWGTALQEALCRWPVHHLSLYQLTIEPGTRFQTLHQRGDLVLPEEETQAQMYEDTAGITADAGLPLYEVSNHARPGQASRHNLVYWRYGDYLGIGPGAHGRLSTPVGRVATRTHRAPELWLERVEREGTALMAWDTITQADMGTEAFLMGLRLAEGVDLRRLERLTGKPIEAVLDLELARDFQAEGLLVLTPSRLALTAAGRLTTNALAAELLL